MCEDAEPGLYADTAPLGIWVVDWFLSDLQPAKEFFSEQQYPKVFDWRQRYREQVAAAKTRGKRGVSLKGADAVNFITSSAFSDQEATVDLGDALQVKEGTAVELFPTDSGGFTHQVSVPFSRGITTMANHPCRTEGGWSN